MIRSERLAVRRDIRRRKACTQQHHLGTPTTTEESTMQITAYVAASNVQHAQAKAAAGQGIVNEYWKAHRVAEDEQQMVFAVTLEIDVVDVNLVKEA